MLEIDCHTCGRYGRLRVDYLINDYGAQPSGYSAALRQDRFRSTLTARGPGIFGKSSLKAEGALTGETVTRATLAERVQAEVGLPQVEAAELVDSVISEISDALVRGEIVKIMAFGNFIVRGKGRRIGRNPKTREEVSINPRRSLTFKASPALKLRVDLALAED